MNRELSSLEQYIIVLYGQEYFELWVKAYYRFDQEAFKELLKYDIKKG